MVAFLEKAFRKLKSKERRLLHYCLESIVNSETVLYVNVCTDSKPSQKKTARSL